jgi:hypothetical protein
VHLHALDEQVAGRLVADFIREHAGNASRNLLALAGSMPMSIIIAANVRPIGSTI